MLERVEDRSESQSSHSSLDSDDKLNTRPGVYILYWKEKLMLYIYI